MLIYERCGFCPLTVRQEGGVERWQDVIFVVRVHISETMSATHTEDPIMCGMQI